ncbi:MAG TPA: hypothetical protein VFR23_05165 [Jiangellaceae bacterium]|nr:hypothetical protein [Jiangellaceae bacterium]
MYDQAAITAVPAGAASAALIATSQVAIGIGVLMAALLILAVVTAMRSHRLDTH